MENMDKWITLPKWVLIADNSLEFICQSPKIWDFNEKRLHWASLSSVLNHLRIANLIVKPKSEQCMNFISQFISQNFFHERTYYFLPTHYLQSCLNLFPELLRVGLLSKTAKNISWPVTGLWNRGPLKDLKDSKLILNESSHSHDHLGSVWYHSEPSEGPYSPNQ